MTTHAPTRAVARIEIHRTRDQARGERLLREARAIGFEVADARVSRVYLIEGILGEDQIERVIGSLLVDPVVERAVIGSSCDAPDNGTVVEVHPLPGVMDPAAQSVKDAIRALIGVSCEVSTGWRYELEGIDGPSAMALARRLLANTIVHAIHGGAFWPDKLPRGHARDVATREVPLIGLDDAALEGLSREAHLFLSLDEMRAIQGEYRELGREPREIELETLAQTWSEHCVHKTLKSTVRYREVGEGIAGGSRGTTRIDWAGRPGHSVEPDGTIIIDNLLKSTIAAATHELIAEGLDWTLSVFVDNAGIVVFDDDHAVCMKVETHNHPSALEPYGGAATGIGGCIRDIIGTGLAAKPIASTDVFCVAYPEGWNAEGAKGSAPGAENRSGVGDGHICDDSAASVSSFETSAFTLPAGCLHPRQILTNIVAGVRDYGNRMGIPTLNGAVEFDDRYVGNPLVFVGSVGIMPRDKIGGDPRGGDLIVALGGRTGRDGIHGATFSSAELTDTHAEEFGHAVQIGNAIEEKRVLDAILRARDAGPLFSSITDCGAGGFSSAVGEMGEALGGEVHLDRAPLKYAGLTSTEVWISEAQERMVLAVGEDNLGALRSICDEEGVELAVLGHFGTPGRELVLFDHGTEIGRLPMAFLHDGIPMPMREACWGGAGVGTDERGGPCASLGSASLRNEQEPGLAPGPRSEGDRACAGDSSPGVKEALLALLGHPSIASKHWIIRQYDHEVQGNTAIKPLVGPMGRGPGDAAVIEPVPGSGRGLAIACGLQVRLGDPALGGDPYQMALGAIDECVRNLVCVGSDPTRISILDNFCWPSCNKPEHMGALVRACEGCYDGAKAYRTPFISGKDSLNNQITIPGIGGGRSRTIEVPYTLLISGMGVVGNVDRCVTMDVKRAGTTLVVVGPKDDALGGSLFASLFGMPEDADPAFPPVNLTRGPLTANAVAQLIQEGIAISVHDVSDGGILVAVAEMLIAGSTKDAPLGAKICDPEVLWTEAMRFAECPSNYIVEVDIDFEREGDPWARFNEIVGDEVGWTTIGEITNSGVMSIAGVSMNLEIDVEELAAAWRTPLDW